MSRGRLIWFAAAVLVVATLPLWLLAAVTLFGANWARGPLERLALERSGRALHIGGDLGLRWVEGRPRVVARTLSFANPAWAESPMMVQADGVEVRVHWRALLEGRLAMTEVRLSHPRIFLEKGTAGRKTWLLDSTQTEESARIEIGRMLVDDGEVDYIDRGESTALHATLSTAPIPARQGAPAGQAGDLTFQVKGQFKGLPLSARGSGGSALAWRDETQPYPLQVQGTLGRTQVQAEGTVTSLRLWKAADLRLRLQGDSLAALFPITGVLLPPTPAFRAEGRLIRDVASWRFESFSGQIGHSLVAGTLQVLTGGERPALSGDLRFQRLDLADLKPAVGAQSAETQPLPSGADRTRVLPALPLDTGQWGGLDADIAFQALTLVAGKALNLSDLKTRILLKDSRLSLEPLAFGWAGGTVQGRLAVDARQQPPQGQVALQLRGLQLGKALGPLLPASAAGVARMGQLDSDAELQGSGPSVGTMLGSAKGRLSLRAQDGQISRLMMEASGLHLLEILQLKLSGDQVIAMPCAVAVFDIEQGLMRARSLVMDTAVNTLQGTGTISLAKEELDLTIVPRTKVSSLVALRAPVHVRGTFGRPQIDLDVGRIAARGAGAVALGLLNPLLAIVPLFEPGPGVKTDCRRLLLEARTGVAPPKN
jgi:AsmA protein